MKNRLITSMCGLMILLGSVMPSMISAYDYDDCCDPCYEDDWCGGFEAKVEFLYWKPCVNDLHYASTVHIQENGQLNLDYCYEFLDPEWEPGFRFAVGKQDIWCGLDLSGSYTYMWASEKDHKEISMNGDNGQSLLVSTIHHPSANIPINFVEAKYTLRYQTFDVLLSYPCTFCDCHLVSPYFGIEGIKLDQTFSSSSNAQEMEMVTLEHEYESSIGTTTSWDSEYCGLGLKVGTGYDYTICDGLHIFSNFSASLTAGDSKKLSRQKTTLFHSGPWNENENENENEGAEQFVNFSHKRGNECVFVPGYHMQLGISYEECVCGFDIAAHVGYEFVQWHHVPILERYFGHSTLEQFGELTEELGNPGSPITAIIDGAGATNTNHGSVGFHGLMAGLSVAF